MLVTTRLPRVRESSTKFSFLKAVNESVFYPASGGGDEGLALRGAERPAV
jgi:hypothetical protein